MPRAVFPVYGTDCEIPIRAGLVISGFICFPDRGDCPVFVLLSSLPCVHFVKLGHPSIWQCIFELAGYKGNELL
jgi:hypothetical protein